jgi:hypothetical protein
MRRWSNEWLEEIIPLLHESNPRVLLKDLREAQKDYRRSLVRHQAHPDEFSKASALADAQMLAKVRNRLAERIRSQWTQEEIWAAERVFQRSI